MKKILFVSGAILLLYSAIFIMLYPRNQGAYFLASIGLVLFLYAFSRGKVLSKCKKGALKFARIAVTCGFCFMLATFAGFCISVAVASTHSLEDGKDALIVLGAGLRGETVSITLAKRLDKAAGYYLENPDVVVVVSGGQGEDELVSEAFAMRKYLISRGVNAENVLLEDKSTNTAENFSFSKAVLDMHFSGEDYSCAYVTNGFHCYRAGKYAEKEGFGTDFLPAHTPFFMMPAYCAREYLGNAHFIVFGKLRLKAEQRGS